LSNIIIIFIRQNANLSQFFVENIIIGSATKNEGQKIKESLKYR